MATYRGKCRECNNLYHREWRARNPGKAAAYSKRWYEEHKNAPVLDNSQNPPNWKRGKVEVCKALRRYGVSTVKECEECGKMASELHENNPDDPNDVTWLCRSCHIGRHVK